MMRDEFIAKALSLPTGTDVVVELLPTMRADIGDIRYDEERQSIVIVPQPDDTRDAYRKFLERAAADAGYGSPNGAPDSRKGAGGDGA